MRQEQRPFGRLNGFGPGQRGLHGLDPPASDFTPRHSLGGEIRQVDRQRKRRRGGDELAEKAGSEANNEVAETTATDPEECFCCILAV